LIWIVLKTPRLPPPPLSGVDFVREGRVVSLKGDECTDGDSGDGDNKEEYDCEVDDFIGDIIFANASKEEGTEVSYEPTSFISNQSKAHQKRKDFRLVLIGDSPVEGIGNKHHNHALGGQTAQAFANLVCSRGEFDRVRYWSYGRSGLTARGIEEEMVPFLYRVVDDVRYYSPISRTGGHATDGMDNDSSSEQPAIHAIILLCGVNNVLDPLSTTASFHSEVRSLLKSIRGRPGLECIPLIVLGLPDFSRLPFLPWPLGFVLGLRGRRMQRALEIVVKEFQQLDRLQGGSAKTIMVNIPEVNDVVGTIGYHRYDSSESNADDTNDERNRQNTSEPLKMRHCHPLLKYLGDHSLDQTKLSALGMKDFLCDDGFHPGGYGTEYIGKLIAEAYGRYFSRKI